MIEPYFVFPGAELVRETQSEFTVRYIASQDPIFPTFRFIERAQYSDQSTHGTAKLEELREWATWPTDETLVGGAGREMPVAAWADHAAVAGAVRWHPLCELFPFDPGLIESLAEDILAKGQAEPVVILDGQVLDGRHRVVACLWAKVRPVTIAFEKVANGLDPEAWVWARNFHRRHLTTGQRAMLGARLATLRRAGVAGESRPTGRASEAVAAQVDVSPRTIEHASAVLNAGAPELVAAVEAGKVTVSAAANLAVLPKDEQRAIIATADPKVVQGAAREAKKADQERKKEEKRARLAATPPQFCGTGIDLRCGDVGLALQPHGNRREVFGDGLVQPALIHADPPWTYRHSGGHGAALNHYPVLSDHDIGNHLQFAAQVAAPDVYLLLWVTSPKLEEAMVAARRSAGIWEYVSQLVWTKPELGVGTHVRGQHELLLIYRRGKPQLYGPAPPSHYPESRRGLEHSEKPHELLRQILPVYTRPGGLVLDLYAGLGSCARACKAAGLPYLGFELEPDRHREALLSLESPEMPLFPRAEGPGEAHAAK